MAAVEPLPDDHDGDATIAGDFRTLLARDAAREASRAAARAEAAQMFRYDFIQPTVNALGYTLAGFTLRWSANA